MECFGNYNIPHQQKCRNCKITTSCKREKIRRYREDQRLVRLKNKLSHLLSIVPYPISTSKIIEDTKNWRYTKPSQEEVKNLLSQLRKENRIYKFVKGNGDYWISSQKVNKIAPEA